MTRLRWLCLASTTQWSSSCAPQKPATAAVQAISELGPTITQLFRYVLQMLDVSALACAGCDWIQASINRLKLLLEYAPPSAIHRLV